MAKRFPSFLLVLIALLLSIALRASAHGGGVSHDDDDDNGEASSGSPPPNLRSRSLILVKIWCLILVFAGTFAGGISPYFLKWNETFLLLGTQFAGGVFLGTALMHFLSDSNETFKDLTEKDYPFAFMLASVGYLLTMFADATIAGIFASERNVQLVEEGNHQEGKSGNYELENNLQPEVAEIPAHNQTVNSLLYKANSLGDSILLILALCFHSVFEGIAIGIAKNKADAWKALWTVSLHKVFAAIAMGIALLRMMPNRPMLSCFAYAFAFAISSPVGVAIGIIIDATTQGHVADWIYAISMGLACGVFIYVSISHLISKGYEACKKIAVPKSSFSRCFAVMLGIAVIAVVMIWDT